MTKILLADDHPIVRKGLKQLLEDELDIEAFGEAEDSQGVLDIALKQDWDVLLLDITMPGRGGLDVLLELKQLRPKLPILVLSMHSEDQFAMRVLKAGAAGYMTKMTAPDELVKAVKVILKGGRYISPTMAEKLVFNLDKDLEKPAHEILSNREYEVMRMIAGGKTISEIGKEMSLSVKTISTYRSRILEKLNLKNNVELTHYAIENNLLD